MIIDDYISSILGIGGIFLNFKGKESEVKNWYKKRFKMRMSDYGASFIEGEQLALLTFKKMNEDSPTLNFRVDVHE